MVKSILIIALLIISCVFLIRADTMRIVTCVGELI